MKLNAIQDEMPLKKFSKTAKQKEYSLHEQIQKITDINLIDVLIHGNKISTAPTYLHSYHIQSKNRHQKVFKCVNNHSHQAISSNHQITSVQSNKSTLVCQNQIFTNCMIKLKLKSLELDSDDCVRYSKRFQTNHLNTENIEEKKIKQYISKNLQKFNKKVIRNLNNPKSSSSQSQPCKIKQLIEKYKSTMERYSNPKQYEEKRSLRESLSKNSTSREESTTIKDPFARKIVKINQYDMKISNLIPTHRSNIFSEISHKKKDFSYLLSPSYQAKKPKLEEEANQSIKEKIKANRILKINKIYSNITPNKKTINGNQNRQKFISIIRSQKIKTSIDCYEENNILPWEVS